MGIELLFRRDSDNREEFEISRDYFHVVENRTDCRNSLVVGRYSVLPFYKELEYDLNNQGCLLLNSYKQHKWIANFEWYDQLSQFTFPTYTDSNFYKARESEYVVKGRTNSRKHQWNRKMFGKNKRAALEIAGEIAADDLIGPQGIIYREYVPLKTFGTGLNGIRFTNEWRCFYYRDQLISHGYYWSMAGEEISAQARITPDAFSLLKNVSEIAQNYCEFYVLDIAEKESGGWILVEVNDGQMSGLSNISPDEFYRNLRKVLDEEVFRSNNLS